MELSNRLDLGLDTDTTRVIVERALYQQQQLEEARQIAGARVKAAEAAAKAAAEQAEADKRAKEQEKAQEMQNQAQEMQNRLGRGKRSSFSKDGSRSRRNSAVGACGGNDGAASDSPGPLQRTKTCACISSSAGSSPSAPAADASPDDRAKRSSFSEGGSCGSRSRRSSAVVGVVVGAAPMGADASAVTGRGGDSPSCVIPEATASSPPAQMKRRGTVACDMTGSGGSSMGGSSMGGSSPAASPMGRRAGAAAVNLS